MDSDTPAGDGNIANLFLQCANEHAESHRETMSLFFSQHGKYEPCAKIPIRPPMQAGRQVGWQAGRQASRQVGRQAGRQACRQEGRHVDCHLSS